MQLGAWKSYDDIEASLTLDELFLIYNGIVQNKIEDLKNMARANGAKFDEDENVEGGEDPEAWNRVMDEVRARKGIKPEAARAPANIGGLLNIKQL